MIRRLRIAMTINTQLFLDNYSGLQPCRNREILELPWSDEKWAIDTVMSTDISS